MHSKIIRLSNNELEQKEQIDTIISALNQSEIVAFPTETVYGLGAIWNDNAAIRKVFEVKGRPLDNPLIIHESSIDRMKTYYADWDKVADVLAREFCPGPFTLIMKKGQHVDSIATAGLDTIGVRIPSHKVANLLLFHLENGIAAPSANISGRPSPTTLEDCYEDLKDKVPYLLDGGDSEVGLESTIVSWVDKQLHLLRPGAISAEQIQECLDSNRIDVKLHIPLTTEFLAKNSPAIAPGMKYRHYAPRALVKMIEGSSIKNKTESLQDMFTRISVSKKIGLYLSDVLFRAFELTGVDLNSHQVISFKSDHNHEDAASGLFAAFREFDRNSCDEIWVEELSDDGVGRAFMNRLKKAIYS